MKRLVLVVAFILAMLAAGLMQYRHDYHKKYFAKRQDFVAIPSGKTLKILSFGYRNLMADMIFIWSIQYYSAYHLTNRYQYLEHVYDVITDISPNYKEPYFVGSWIMALEKGDIPMAIRLLQKGALNMKDEYIFDYECGFYAYKYLKDFKKAEFYFKKAADHPNAPPLVQRKRAHMTYMQDDLEYAYQLWMDILKNSANDKFARSAARNHLHQIKNEKDKKKLEQKINEFKQRYGRNPNTLNELVRAGLISEIPKDFSGTDYIYDAKKGTVKAHKEYKWKKSY
jgi:tetratricopeptide (TPR) repeat protein